MYDSWCVLGEQSTLFIDRSNIIGLERQYAVVLYSATFLPPPFGLFKSSAQVPVLLTHHKLSEQCWETLLAQLPLPCRMIHILKASVVVTFALLHNTTVLLTITGCHCLAHIKCCCQTTSANRSRGDVPNRDVVNTCPLDYRMLLLCHRCHKLTENRNLVGSR